MEAQLILLSGKQGSGKTTILNALVECLQYCQNIGIVTFKFADPIYRFHDMIWAEMQNTYGIDRKTVKDRNLLQLIGTDWGRNTVDPDIWAKAAKTHWNSQCALAESKGLKRVIGIIDDLRFPNELATFKDEGIFVRLEASEEVRKNRSGHWDGQQHESETALDKFEFDWDLVLPTDQCTVQDCTREILTFVLRS